MEIFHTFLFQPIYNLLIFLYNVIPGSDLGLAIIAITLLIKGLLWPLAAKSLKSQRALQQLQPKINALKDEYKDDKEGMSKAMMELYKTEKVNPMSSCLPLLIQLPILFALYRVFLHAFDTANLYDLYSFVAQPAVIDTSFFGIADLSEKSILLAFAAGIVQFFQARMMNSRQPQKDLRKKEGAKDENMMASMNKSMVYFMPVITIFIGMSLPGALALYWFTNNLITVGQQAIFFREPKDENKLVEAKEERETTTEESE